MDVFNLNRILSMVQHNGQEVVKIMIRTQKMGKDDKPINAFYLQDVETATFSDNLLILDMGKGSEFHETG